MTWCDDFGISDVSVRAFGVAELPTYRRWLEFEWVRERKRVRSSFHISFWLSACFSRNKCECLSHPMIPASTYYLSITHNMVYRSIWSPNLYIPYMGHIRSRFKGHGTHTHSHKSHSISFHPLTFCGKEVTIIMLFESNRKISIYQWSRRESILQVIRHWWIGHNVAHRALPSHSTCMCFCRFFYFIFLFFFSRSLLHIISYDPFLHCSFEQHLLP